MDLEILEQAKSVLAQNDRGTYTVPAGDLYPHQWLWDSCFIAIGLRHLNLDRAKMELESLAAGQWANGMLPHIIFNAEQKHHKEHNLWQSWLNPHAPNGIITSGLTQPPMLAEAVVQIGEKLKLPERRSWYKKMYPVLAHHHSWIYNERDIYNEGLACLIHPYESGLDNTPSWVMEINKYAWPWWLKIIDRLNLEVVANLVRRDIKHVPPGQRISNNEAIAYWYLLKNLRSKSYDSKTIIANKPKILVEDLAFNSIFVRSNKHLQDIAKTIGETIPSEVIAKMKKSEEALELLWDETEGRYFSCSLVGKGLIKEPSISTLLPLYAGCISQERAEHLVSLLKKRSQFKASWPIPSVPISSSYFNDIKYWQGPTWINTNWLIIEGLKNYGFDEEAEKLKTKTLELVKKGGMNEYFSPLNAVPAGATNFSWTAALTIDFIVDK